MKLHPSLSKVSAASKVVFGWAMLFLLSYCTVTAHSINKQTIQLLEVVRMEEDPNPFVTTWTSGGGAFTHTVTTTPKEGEDEDDTAARHARRVAALAKLFEPDVT